jgi:membrane protease YdiL (CAAX protease family)
MNLAGSADVVPAQEHRFIAPKWHTGIVLAVLAAVTFFAMRAHGTSTAGQDLHGGIPLYASVIFSEWALFYLAYAGTRKRTALRELIGLRWAGRAAFVRSVLITIGFWFLWEGSGRAMHWLLGPSDTRNVTSMLPRTALEIFFWILVSISAGICEEFVYRGYLQRQFAAMTRSTPAALVLQAVVFGVSHGYQGRKQVVIISVLGALYGLLAQWRRSLAPGMAAHAWSDVYSGWLSP